MKTREFLSDHSLSLMNIFLFVNALAATAVAIKVHHETQLEAKYANHVPADKRCAPTP